MSSLSDRTRAVLRSAAKRLPYPALGALLVWLVASLLLAACHPARLPIEIDSDLSVEELPTLVLMPVLDIRSDRFGFVEVGHDTAKAARRVLHNKGYGLVPAALSSDTKNRPAAELATLSACDLAALTSTEGGAVLIIYVEGASEELRRWGKRYSVKLSAVLVSREARHILWRDRAVGSSNLGGLLSVLSRPSSRYEAVYDALANLFSTLPDRS